MVQVLTDEDGNEVREDFGTLDDVRKVAKELANKYHKDICINTVIGEAIVDYESPDEEIEAAETTELFPECETEAERNESAVSEPEQNEIPQEVIETCEEIIRPAVNALYKAADELTVLFSGFSKACITTQY